MTKSEKRVKRQLLKSESKADENKRLISRLNLIDNFRPKIEILSADQKKSIINIDLSLIEVPIQPKSSSGSRFEYLMTWCARKMDICGKWNWQGKESIIETRSLTKDEWVDVILPQMNSLERMPWKEIESQISDSGLRMHHGHDIGDIHDDAIDRWIELGYEQFDVIFRFRLGNTRRAWGIELHGHFFMIWYERHHKIYAVK